MRIFVTGGNGMLAGYILRELIRTGYAVTSYSRHPALVQGVESVVGDVTDLAKLEETMRGHEVVVHLAAVPGPARAAPDQLMYVNVIGTTRVLEAAVHTAATKVIFASSGAATGFTFQHHEIIPRYLPIDEDHPAEPQDEYGLSKLLGEVTCKRYSQRFGIRTLCFRISPTWYTDREGASVAVLSSWGKGLTVEDLWTRRCRKCLLQPEGDWPLPGPPRPRNVLWAVSDGRDVAQAVRLGIENQVLLHEVFAINASETCSLVPTRELVARYFAPVPLRAQLEGFASLVSHEKATRLLGYRPQYSWRKSDFWDWLQGMG